jgi:tubulin monoglycylase TTLL3/8
MWAIWAKNQLWWYKEGYLRTSSKEFNLTSTSRFVHLTNDAVQINNEDYGKHEPANKLSFAEFERYLEKEQGPNCCRNHFSYIYEQMRDLTVKMFTICKDQLV